MSYEDLFEKDEVLELHITEMADSGEGVGFCETHPIHVEGAVVGDLAKVKITTVKKNYVAAKLIKLLKPAMHRIEPICPFFKKCSGCQIMNLDYQKGQLAYKRDSVKNALETNGVLTNQINVNVIGVESPFRYGNQAYYTVALHKNELKIGFSEMGSPIFQDLHDCMAQREIHAIILEVIREYLYEFDIPIYDELSHKGLVRGILIRDSELCGEVMVVIVANNERIPKEAILRDRLLEAVPEMTSFILNINQVKDQKGLGSKHRVLYGNETINDQIGRLTVALAPETAFPKCAEQIGILFENALKLLNPSDNETIYMPANQTGIFSDWLLANDINLMVNDNELVQSKCDSICLNTNRKGCDSKLIDRIVDIKPKKIVYVGESVHVLAKDIKLICESGLYRIATVSSVDCHPNNVAVDAVVLLELI